MKKWLPPLILCLVVIAGLAPAIFTNYALSDDYAYLYWGNAGSYRLFYDVCILYGRPLLGPVMLPPFIWIDTLSQVVLLRLLGVLGSLVLALCGARLLQRETNFGVLSCGLFGVLLALNPGNAYQAMWAACFPYPLASALALLAGYVLAKQLGGGFSRRRALEALGCVLALYLILNVYQPSALVALVGGLLACLSAGGRERIVRPLAFLAIMGVLFVGYYQLTKHVVQPLLFGGSLPPWASRYGLNLDPAAQAAFALDVVARGLALWSDLDGGVYKLVSILVVAALSLWGIFAWSAGNVRLALAGAAVFALFAGFALAPLVVNSERAYFCRTMVAFYGLVSVPLIFGLRRLRGGAAVRAGAGIGLLALFAGSSFFYVRQTAENSRWEQAVLRQVVVSAVTPDTKTIVFIRPQHRAMQRTPRLREGDTWAMLSSWVEMFPKPMLQEIADERFGKNRAPQFQIYSITKKQPRPAADLVIDGPSLLNKGSLGETAPVKREKARLRKVAQEL